MSETQKENNELPVPVTNFPFWRVSFRPETYVPDLIPTLTDCVKLVEKTRVRLRGWDFPNWSPHKTEESFGSTYIASWANFMGSIEYWRLYQSGQFVHLAAVREVTEGQWRVKLQQETIGHLGRLSAMRDKDWDSVPGYISLINLVYIVTEVFEFAARICQAGVYRGVLSVSIEINGIKGFVLTTDFDRAWSEYCAAGEDHFGRAWQISSDNLVSASAEHSMTAIAWFCERFGWLSPNLNALKNDQQKFLAGRR